MARALLFASIEGTPMKKLLNRIEAFLTAAAFAEEGEVETARRIVAEAGGEDPRAAAPVLKLPKPRRRRLPPPKDARSA